jgi:uncharacterized protein (TIGR03435 family)
MQISRVSLAASILAVRVVMAQSAPKPREFEVAAVKPSDPQAKGANVLVGAGDSLNISNVPLSKIVTFAYGIRDFQLAGGPGWISTEHYDITAKTARDEASPGSNNPKTMTDSQRRVRDERLRERLRTLLADRFGLVVHHDSKEQTVYALMTAKNGPKLTVVTTPGNRQGISVNGGRLQGFAAPMLMLAMQLSDATRRVVVDETNLTEKYDFVLEWTPDALLEHEEGPGAVPGAGASGPSIFTALREQLGLQLKSKTGAVDVIVIDHIDRPSAN